MGIFHDGTTDSLQSQFHKSIEWSVQYNRIVGSCVDSPLFREIVPSAVIGDEPQEAGYYEIYSSIARQTTKFSWYQDAGLIHFQVISVSEPS